jgi:flagellar biosynthesis protein
MNTPDQDIPKSAVALRYDSASGASPRVTAKGKGLVAEQILATARAHGVPIREDKDLVELLSACELLDEIPVELYAAVAYVLAYLHALNQERARPALDPPC